VYIHELYLEEIEKYLLDLYQEEIKLKLKEYTFFKESLNKDEFAVQYVGWLDLNNYFLFFRKKEHLDNLVKVLTELKEDGVEIEK
jgi:protein-tyrosine phosphatase